MFAISQDNWLDRWGHLALWIGPYILVVSVIVWTPRLALLLLGVELLQFTLHVRCHHPSHTLTPVSFLIVPLAWVMVVVGTLISGVTFHPWSLGPLGFLVGCQVMFSDAVHLFRHRHANGTTLILYASALSLIALSVLILCRFVLDPPAFNAYLFVG